MGDAVVVCEFTRPAATPCCTVRRRRPHSSPHIIKHDRHPGRLEGLMRGRTAAPLATSAPALCSVPGRICATIAIWLVAESPFEARSEFGSWDDALTSSAVGDAHSQRVEVWTAARSPRPSVDHLRDHGRSIRCRHVQPMAGQRRCAANPPMPTRIPPSSPRSVLVSNASRSSRSGLVVGLVARMKVRMGPASVMSGDCG